VIRLLRSARTCSAQTRPPDGGDVRRRSVTGVTVVGVRGHLVAVEAHVGRGLPSLTLTGLFLDGPLGRLRAVGGGLGRAAGADGYRVPRLTPGFVRPSPHPRRLYVVSQAAAGISWHLMALSYPHA
jgi:hypothetical protein